MPAPSTTPDRTGATTWFRRVMCLGIVANLALAVPTLVAPARMLAVTGFPVPDPIVWTRFAALLLVLLSAFYVPAAIDPVRYRAGAWLAVASRLAGVTFFGIQARAYWPLGAFDLVFLVPQAILLARLSR